MGRISLICHRWRTATLTAPSASFSTDEPSVLRGFNETLDFKHVASRNGLVVLRRLRPCPLFGQSIEEGPPGSVLRVCYSFTGAVSILPTVSIRDYRKHALLFVEKNGRAFELLVADERLRIQIYSSREGRWGPVRVALPRRQSRPFHDSTPWSLAAPSTGCATRSRCRR